MTWQRAMGAKMSRGGTSQLTQENCTGTPFRRSSVSVATSLTPSGRGTSPPARKIHEDSGCGDDVEASPRRAAVTAREPHRALCSFLERGGKMSAVLQAAGVVRERVP